jgi:NADH-quinone oxidoreductase subunit C
METPDQIRDRLLARFPGAEVSVVINPGPSAQHSLLLGAAHASAIATFLRDDPVLRLDSCSNVTGVDWPEREVVETVRKTLPPEPGADPAAPAKVIEEKVKRRVPGHLEVVYHLYSVALKHGPVILRLRTGNRSDQVKLPSLTPVWRSCEFQEREVFDLYGVVFTGHPDLRRILMWDEFRDHPMRKDYVEPDDYEWEPTPHDAVLEKARRHYSAPPAPAPQEGAAP